MGAQLVAIGKGLPTRRIPNKIVIDLMNRAREKNPELSQKILTPEWLEETVLIEERLWASETQNNSDLALLAVNETLIKGNIPFNEIGLIISATSSPEMWFPSIPCIMMQKMGLARGPMAFDLLAACTGAVYAIDIMNAMFMAHTNLQYALIISSEIISRNLDLRDPNSALFGDMATAMIFKRNDFLVHGVLVSVSGTLPDGADLAYSQGRANRSNNDFLNLNYAFNGKRVHGFVIKIIQEAIEQLVKTVGINIQEIDLIIPHQANGKIAKKPAQALNISEDKFFINIQKYGNTSTCSIPLALYEAIDQGRAKPGDLIALVGYGSGLAWGANLIRL